MLPVREHSSIDASRAFIEIYNAPLSGDISMLFPSRRLIALPFAPCFNLVAQPVGINGV
jgi:hypothetical protein